MIRGRCPICSKPFEAESLGAHPPFPFCSRRCQLVDLGRWVDGAYAIPEKGDSGERETSISDEDEEET